MCGRCEWFGHMTHYVSDESLTYWTVGQPRMSGQPYIGERRVANLLALFEFGRRCRQTELICRGSYLGHAQASEWKHITHKVCGAHQIILERHVADFRKKIPTIAQGTFSQPVALMRVIVRSSMPRLCEPPA